MRVIINVSLSSVSMISEKLKQPYTASTESQCYRIQLNALVSYHVLPLQEMEFDINRGFPFQVYYQIKAALMCLDLDFKCQRSMAITLLVT